MWFLNRYTEQLDQLLKNEPRLRGLVSTHSEFVWNQFEVQKSHLSFDQPVDSLVDYAYPLSVFELVLLDDLLCNLFLVRGTYPPNLYSALNLHPVIRAKTEKLFREGNYNEAISEAYIALIDTVKEKAGHPRDPAGKELDGTKLMQEVFTPNAPKLRFNELKTQVDIDEQTGLMNIFVGAVFAVRNVFLHKSKEQQEDPYVAIEYIQLASLLAKKLEKAKP